MTDPRARVAAVEVGGELAVFRSISVDVGIKQQQVAPADLHAPNFCFDCAGACLDLDRHGLAVDSYGGFHRLLVDVGLQIFFLLPAVAIEALEKISVAVKYADADQRDIEIGGALDVIAGKHSESAGIHRNRFVQAELGGKIGHWTRTQRAGMFRAPSTVCLEIFLLAAVGVVDTPVQYQFVGAALNAGQRHLAQQRHRIVVELAPARRIEIEKNVDRVLIPTPPEVARQGPQPFLDGSDKTRERARLADDRRQLGSGLRHHMDFDFVKAAVLDSLNDEDALQDTPIDERHAKK